MQLPKKLIPYEKKAESIIKKGLVKDIEFSGSTFQILVLDHSSDLDGNWAFLQLDAKGDLLDSFCGCEESETHGACPHIAAAYLRIYNERERPIHSRFRDSLWNELCIIFLDRLGDLPSQLNKISDVRYEARDHKKNLLFYIESKTSEGYEKLESIIESRIEETEETSLKFSNLTEDELNLWRQGKPTPQLKYELSFWYDIAKWLMILQDLRKPYNIVFSYSDTKIPTSIKISFPELEIFFHLRREDLIKIIPFLSSVNSPLSVHTTQREAIQKIVYDKHQAALIVELKENHSKSEEPVTIHDKEYIFGGWIYIPGEGFYAIDQHHILAEPKIEGKRISDVLESHSTILKKLLVGDEIHEDPIKLSHHLFFDENWNLHIEAYLFQPEDLTIPYSRSFGKWVYQDPLGFFRVEGQLFQDLHTEILNEDVHTFVSQYRFWLNLIPGFNTHLKGIEINIGYEITPNLALQFHRLIASSKQTKTKDFGAWVYVEGEGFYSKINTNIGVMINYENPIPFFEVSNFIKKNSKELILIPNFFNKENPVINIYLKIFTEINKIYIEPQHELISSAFDKNVIFFDDYVYVEEQGFYEIPLKFRLPLEYREKICLTTNEEIQKFLENDLPAFSSNIHKIDKKIYESSNITLEAEKIIIPKSKEKGTYGFQLYYVSDQGEINLADLWKALEQGKRYYFSDAGRIDFNEQRFQWLKSLKKKQVDFRSNTIYLSTLEFLRINSFDEIILRKNRQKNYSESRKILDNLLNLTILDKPDLSLLKSNLWPYQETGVSWLWFLYLNQLSGLLCDDMGLGKTHQSMALIAGICKFNQEYHLEKKLHFLVVCPTSVIYHWQEKVNMFLPNLRVCTYHGMNRSFNEFLQDYDILLTSYGVWRNEVANLKKVHFELAILDEIQIAKNHSSGIHKALLKINSSMFLGLTGTPIENKIRELKALFDIILPGYMMGDKEYYEYFIKPIEKDENHERKTLLQRYVKPFILRRRKEEVLLDLPTKIEEVSHCELLEEQFILYNQVIEQSEKKIIDELKNDSQPIPYIHIFALLSSLKQICNHPAVYFKDPDNYDNYQSGKWNLFLELLSEARESGQKVVIFSQFLTMLDIFENYLNDHKIGYASIRGATIKRAEEIKRFNHDPNCEVFIGSLQASGLGIDLTAGNVVIHYDRWWNAAREDQATDRVHRLGQKRGVQVFKLVTKNTFEEDIDQMITKKGKWLEEVIGTDDHGFVKKFSRDELIQLLHYVKR